MVNVFEFELSYMIMATEASPDRPIHIIHFNDVYNINPTITKDADGNILSITGGAARFKSIIESLSPLNPLILFRFDSDRNMLLEFSPFSSCLTWNKVATSYLPLR